MRLRRILTATGVGSYFWLDVAVLRRPGGVRTASISRGLGNACGERVRIGRVRQSIVPDRTPSVDRRPFDPGLDPGSGIRGTADRSGSRSPLSPGTGFAPRPPPAGGRPGQPPAGPRVSPVPAPGPGPPCALPRTAAFARRPPAETPAPSGA